MLTITRWDKSPFYFINGNLDSTMVKILYKQLSYFVQGSEHTAAFKQGTWNGYEVLLYKNKNGAYYFPIGLKQRVISIFDAFEIEYDLRDITFGDVSKNYKSLGLTWNGPKLRDYQEKAVNDLIDHGGGIVSLPTGAGKTVVALKYIQYLDKPFLVVVPGKDLMYQWQREIQRCLGIDPSIVGDGKKVIKEDSAVGTMQSLFSLVQKGTTLDFPILELDEIHRAACNQVYGVSMHCNAVIRLGTSATVYRSDGADLKIFASVGEIQSVVTPEELIDRGILAKPRFIFQTPPPSRYYGKTWQQAYTNGIVANEGRNELIANTALSLAADGYRVFVSVDRIEHMDVLTSMIPGSVSLQGKDPTKKRKKIFEQFAQGIVRVLVSTLLREGIDIPEISAFIAGGATKSPVSVVQRVGRALRVAPGKDDAVICDFRDYGNRYLGRWWEERYNTYKSTYGSYCPEAR